MTGSSAIKEIRLGLDKLQKIKAELQVEFDRLSSLRDEQSRKLARLRGLKQEKIDLIAKINRQRDLNVRLLDELKNEGENLTRFLDQRPALTVIDPVDFKQMQGKLAWPLAGNIISSFGKKKSARFNTYTMQQRHRDQARGNPMRSRRSAAARSFFAIISRATATCSSSSTWEISIPCTGTATF